MKQKILITHQSFIDGIIEEDYQKVDELLAEDVTFGTPGGGFGTKRDYINALKTGTLFYDSVANHVPNIRIFGKTGVVNGKVDLVFRYKDETGSWFKMLEHLTFTSLYVVEGNNVKMESWQSTRPVTDEAIALPQEAR